MPSNKFIKNQLVIFKTAASEAKGRWFDSSRARQKTLLINLLRAFSPRQTTLAKHLGNPVSHKAPVPPHQRSQG